jgi:GTPase involved in cell partitioning and DNA repair
MSGDPVQEYGVPCDELRKYESSMLEKPRIICISKMDTVTDADRPILEELDFGKEYKVLLISAVSGENIEILKREIWKILAAESNS